MDDKKTVYSKLCEEYFEKEDFLKDLYRFSVYVAINRLSVQIKNVTEKKLLDYVGRLFSVPSSAHAQNVAAEHQETRSSMCNLVVFIEKGDDLTCKDSNGFSDPFCLLAITPDSRMHNLSKDKYAAKRTKFVKSTLNPVWEESFEILVSRENVKSSFLQIQVWDHDEENLISKKLKGLKHYNKDDFMGYSFVPLSEIPADGIYKDLRLAPGKKLTRVSGQIRIKLNLAAVKEVSSITQRYSDDLIFAGLSDKVVRKAFRDFQSELPNSSDLNLNWNEILPAPAAILLQEMKQQFNVPLSVTTLIDWENCCRIFFAHSASSGVYFEKLLLELNRCHLDLQHRAPPFNVDMMISSIAMFVEKKCSSIAEFCEKFDIEMIKTSSNEVKYNLQLLKSLFSMKMFRFVRNALPDFELSIRNRITEALEEGVLSHYKCLRDDGNPSEYQFKVNGDFQDDKTTLQQDIDVKGMISLCVQLSKDTILSSDILHPLFDCVFKLDFAACVCAVVHENLSRDISKVMSKAHKDLKNEPELNQLKEQISALFQLHHEVKKLFNVEETVKKKLGLKFFDSSRPISDHKHREWFLPVIYEWIAFCKDENKRVVSQAVAMDKVKRVDDIVTYSTSAVDTVDWLATIIKTWKSWKWFSVNDAYAISLFLSRDLGEAVKAYIDVVYETLRAVGFFDDEGQFDVTEELCVALNNLQHVRKFAAQISTMMGFDELSAAISAEPNGPSQKVASFNLCQAIDDSLLEIDRQINAITAEVGRKMTPDICKWLQTFVERTGEKNKNFNDIDISDDSMLKNFETISAEASDSVMKYLAKNMMVLSEWLCQENITVALETLWKVSIKCLRKIALVEIEKPSSIFCYQCRYLLKMLATFFHEDGNGLSMKKMKSVDFDHLEAELNLRSSSTEQLIKDYYMKMYSDQQASNEASLGVLSIMTQYDESNKTINVDVISATNLTPKDLNGLSDPFVQIRLEPHSIFKDHEILQTSVQRNTLDPIWQETFSFALEHNLVEEKGAVMVFTVLDYDRFKYNEFEGKAVLPLHKLVQKSRDTIIFQMPLLGEERCISRKESFSNLLLNGHQKLNFLNLGDESSGSEICVDGPDNDIEDSLVVTPLQLLQDRSQSDPDAAEFWKRKKTFKKLKS